MQLPAQCDAFLLGHLLEANTSLEGWQRFMQAVLSHYNTRSFHLYLINNSTQAMRFHVDAGEIVSAEYMAAYVEHYIHQDRLMAAVNDRPAGQFYASNLLPEDVDVYGNDYFKNWAIPQGIKEGAVARIYTEGDWTCYMACNRTAEQDPFTHEEISRMNLLIPFIEKSVRTSASQAEQDKHELRAKALVNTYRFPAAVLTEYGEVWAQNHAMTEYISSNQIFRLEQRTLKLTDSSNDKSLNLGILQTIKRANGVDMEMEQAERIPLPDGGALGFHSLFENYQNRQVFVGVMVYIINKDFYGNLPIERLRLLFNLTQAEAETCGLLATGLLPKQIAAQRNKSVYTIREQLSNIYQKTGCNNQVSLINLLSNIPL
ncbi:helix-turn-helix transcriptional regulator [Thalassolituus hydrocarboniclasticus]|uniref:Helix-turn-helix transcriptional regulator n=1 Tax=Thalassolituus hydrocarboniclasticus TaxID=2742796 RepID=A0ABY6ABW4_9GAMM|nr:helix-turn-helix transcriptional regulator [Thalassolituus hydrocarboniclasticus]UXD87698.1 helix-turn-helix transcriptional regulator [Thalassolituus hydrocarboniclasticus]